MGIDTRVIEVPGHFNWPANAPYAHAVQAGPFLFVGGQVALDTDGRVVGLGDIEAQTRAAFENVTRALRAAGADWRNVVTMNTFYDLDAEGPQIEEDWKRMTRVRLEFLPKLAGPCGTGLRAKLPLDGLMIQVEVVAVLPPHHDHRVRLMPEQLWDWPMPGPFTQGWRVGDYVFVGGQISADRAFNVLGQHDLDAQSRNVSDNIGTVLQLGNTSWDNIIRLKAFYDVPDWGLVRRVHGEYSSALGPGITAAETPLAAAGLLLETEAVAVMPGVKKEAIVVDDLYQEQPFVHGWRVGDLVFIAAQTGMSKGGACGGTGDLRSQAQKMYDNFGKVLKAAGSGWENVLKLNTYWSPEVTGFTLAEQYQTVASVRSDYLGAARPVETSIRMGLPYPGCLIQTDGIAVASNRT
jgi:enamine deaminase RidA (YjgF/YER057c/UK114 family)